MLPLDVANNEASAGCTGYGSNFCGGLDMALAWEIIYMITLLFVVLFIPFAIFYYEADDGQGNLKESMLCGAVKFEILVLAVSGLALSLMYIVSGVLVLRVLELCVLELSP